MDGAENDNAEVACGHDGEHKGDVPSPFALDEKWNNKVEGLAPLNMKTRAPSPPPALHDGGGVTPSPLHHHREDCTVCKEDKSTWRTVVLRAAALASDAGAAWPAGPLASKAARLLALARALWTMCTYC